MLKVRGLTVRYGDLTIVEDVSLSLEEGQWLMVVGPNGAGKSTLLGGISRRIPYTGGVLLEGQDMTRLKPRQAAAAMGVVMQSYHVGYPFTVEEVVKLGRYAHRKGFFSDTNLEDQDKVEEALELTGMAALRKQTVTTLSGGELQRTFLAQVLAQNPRLILLDEPTSHLDLLYQKQVLDLMKKWLQGPGRALISVVHDLSLAKAYGTHGLLMNRGKGVALGRTEEVLTREHLAQVYQMDVYNWMEKMLGQWQEE